MRTPRQSRFNQSRFNYLAVLLGAWMILFLGVRNSSAGPDEPSIEILRSLIDGYAHAIETNNRDLALWYIHPRSPRRSDIDASLRDQLSSYMERARTSHLERIELPDGTISAKLDQEFIRVIGMKFTRGSRRSIYQFRDLGDTWRIWRIDEAEDS
jgi:hypothetical protein